MSISIPMYLNGKEVINYKTGKPDYTELFLDEYIVRIETPDDINVLTSNFKRLEDYTEFFEDIQKKELLQQFKNKQIQFKNDYNRLKSDLPKSVVEQIQNDAISMSNLIKEINQKSMKYMKENIEELKQYIQKSIEEKKNKIKEKRQEYNKKYYLKKKEEMNASLIEKPDKPILTHTEKRKLWNKKYYQSKKELIAQLATLTEKS